jgi:hypothetical protein
VEKRCEEIMAEAERKVEELQMELKVQLMFLPEQVRAMKWKTFVEDFGASLEKVLQNVAPLQFSYSTTSVVQNEEEEDEDDKEGGDRRSVSICPATVISKPRGSASIMSTPAFIRKGPGASSNVFQTPASAVFSCKHPPSVGFAHKYCYSSYWYTYSGCIDDSTHSTQGRDSVFFSWVSYFTINSSEGTNWISHCIIS